MLNALLVFLIGVLVLAVVIYVFNMIVNMLTLPAEVKQIALLIIGLIGLIFLILITIHAFQSAGGHPIILVQEYTHGPHSPG